MTPQQPGPCGQCPRVASGFVLVVDDDEHMRRAFNRILTHTGYRVVVAVNARSALDELHAGHLPCAILLDLEMPIMDGWKFLMERQRDTTLWRIPVALVSGSIDKRALALDAECHLAKPFDANQLLATVQRCCAIRNEREPSV